MACDEARAEGYSDVSFWQYTKQSNKVRNTDASAERVIWQTVSFRLYLLGAHHFGDL